MNLALLKAQEIDADVVMATDPDADRVGIGVKDNNGEWVLLNGNQTGGLLIGYMIRAWKEAGKITGKEMVIKTIVTTELIDKMAEANGVACYNTLTGFKYIAEIIKEKEGKETFIAGGEESYGYLIGDKVRDKDAVASCGMIAEMVAYAKDKGIEEKAESIAISKEKIGILFKSFVGRNVLDEKGFYPIYLTIDTTFNRAVFELENM